MKTKRAFSALLLVFLLVGQGWAQQFVDFPPVRKAGYSGILGDIDNHNSSNTYRDADLVTFAHESTHGANSIIRNRFQGQAKGRINGFYCLNDKACVIVEPPTTVRAAAAMVPASLRGMSFNLYLVQQAGSWNNEPLYICDEWTSYSNGTAEGLERRLPRAESTQQMLEFMGYAFCLAGAVENARQAGRNYDDTQFKDFLRFQVGRVCHYYGQTRDCPSMGSAKCDAYWTRLRSAQDAEALRVFVRWYLGEEWVKQTLGF